MDSNGNLIISIEDNIRLVGTAHVSKDSVELVKSEIEQWNLILLLLSCVKVDLRHFQKIDV